MESEVEGPMSPILFNLVMDEWFRCLPPDIGWELGDDHISSLTYADDLLLLAGSRRSYMLSRCVKFFYSRGLTRDFTARKVPAKKNFSLLQPANILWKQHLLILLDLDEFRYLGKSFNFVDVNDSGIKEL